MVELLQLLCCCLLSPMFVVVAADRLRAAVLLLSACASWCHQRVQLCVVQASAELCDCDSGRAHLAGLQHPLRAGHASCCDGTPEVVHWLSDVVASGCLLPCTAPMVALLVVWCNRHCFCKWQPQLRPRESCSVLHGVTHTSLPFAKCMPFHICQCREAVFVVCAACVCAWHAACWFYVARPSCVTPRCAAASY
jgi:hypothetical protein